MGIIMGITWANHILISFAILNTSLMVAMLRREFEERNEIDHYKCTHCLKHELKDRKVMTHEADYMNIFYVNEATDFHILFTILNTNL
jgi:hypothetical protein